MPRTKTWDDYPAPVRDGSCLRWQGPHHTNGYGLLGRHGYAHRVAWEREQGPLAEGLTIDHVKDRGCRFRDCVNTEHMEPVTQGENATRGERIAAQLAATHCPQGHPYSGDNLIVRRGKAGKGEGWRRCRTCQYESNARSRQRARQRAAAVR